MSGAAALGAPRAEAAVTAVAAEVTHGEVTVTAVTHGEVTGRAGMGGAGLTVPAGMGGAGLTGRAGMGASEREVTGPGMGTARATDLRAAAGRAAPGGAVVRGAVRLGARLRGTLVGAHLRAVPAGAVAATATGRAPLTISMTRAATGAPILARAGAAVQGEVAPGAQGGRGQLVAATVGLQRHPNAAQTLLARSALRPRTAGPSGKESEGSSFAAGVM